jgi:hypothetical protein
MRRKSSMYFFADWPSSTRGNNSRASVWEMNGEDVGHGCILGR